MWAHRGVQMASSATRKPPHAFNFLRECDVLARSGFGKTAEEQFAVAWFVHCIIESIWNS